MSKDKKEFVMNKIRKEVKKQFINHQLKELEGIIKQNAKLNKILRNTFAPYSPWVCPKCGAVYGPGVKECWRCNPIQITFTFK